MNNRKLKQETAEVRREIGELRNRLDTVRQTYAELERITNLIRTGQAA